MTSSSLSQWDAATGAYVLIKEKTGSDWIGFQQIARKLTPGHYKVEALVSWVANAYRDFTIGLYCRDPITIYECVGAGTGFAEVSTRSGSPAVDRCQYLREGVSFVHGSKIESNNPYFYKEPAALHPKVNSVGMLLEGQLNQFLPGFRELPYIQARNNGWYMEY